MIAKKDQQEPISRLCCKKAMMAKPRVSNYPKAYAANYSDDGENQRN